MDKDDMTVKISDFGFAKMVGERVFYNTICGTPSYGRPSFCLWKVIEWQTAFYDLDVDLFLSYDSCT